MRPTLQNQSIILCNQPKQAYSAAYKVILGFTNSSENIIKCRGDIVIQSGVNVEGTRFCDFFVIA